MQQHLYDILRFSVYMLVLIAAVIIMVKADDNSVLRRLTTALAAVGILCNDSISYILFLVIGSILETVLAIIGIAFLIVLALAVMILPFVLVIRWLTH